MQITVEGCAHTLIPIWAFRAAHSLPDSFGVASFEPKDFTGLGRIDTAGAALLGLRADVLAATPAGLPIARWRDALPALIRRFEASMTAINDQIGLRAPEIEFAVGGFSDALYAYAYAAIRSGAAPDFMAAYGAWLDESVRVSQTVYGYPHGDEEWAVWVLNYVYGRLGLIVEIPGGGRHYLLDSSYACPAEGFMLSLLRDCAAKLRGATL